MRRAGKGQGKPGKPGEIGQGKGGAGQGIRLDLRRRAGKPAGIGDDCRGYAYGTGRDG
jgi:hypothetical protein